jgi:hypothetical protein
MKVGYAKREITPPVGIRLGGYAHRLGKPSQIVHDPLYASAIFIESSDGEEAVLIHADVLGIYKDLADEIKSTASRKVGIAPNKIFLTTTHTHSGPETIIPMWPNTFPYSKEEKKMFEDWLNSFKEKVVETVFESVNEISHSLAKVGTTNVPNLTFNRTYKNGVVDTQVPFIFFDGEERNKKILILNYTCHPVCNTDFGISADYPGGLYLNFKRYGIESFFTTGATGDIDPLMKGREFISKMSSEISLAVLSELSSAKEIRDEEIRIEKRGISLSLRTVIDSEKAKTKFERMLKKCRDKLNDTECLSGLLYADEEYEIAKENRTHIESVIQALILGDNLVFISVPGELFVEFGLKIKNFAKLKGYSHAIIACYSEDYIGYIPDNRAYEMGAYEATLARWSRITPGSGDLITSEILKILEND